MSFRRWCFTLNNPTSDIDFTGTIVRYAIWQKEQGEKGTPHYQGYLSLEKASRLSAMKLLIPGAHFESCKGNHEDNKRYCSKTEGRIAGPWTYGSEPEPGKRTDLDEIKEKIMSNVPMKQIATEHFGDFVRYGRSFREFKSLMVPERTVKTIVELHWGVPNSGKSHYARSFAGAYWKDQGQWWDGYDNQETVVIDEFYGWLQPSFILRLFDCYPMRVESKGGSAQFTAKRIIVTSNTFWTEWWKSDIKYNREAMERRFDVIKEYTTRYTPPPPKTVEEAANAECE